MKVNNSKKKMMKLMLKTKMRTLRSMKALQEQLEV